MIDIRLLETEKERIEESLKKRNAEGVDLNSLEELNKKRRELLSEVEHLKAKRNTVSKQIGQMIQAGEDPAEIKAETKKLGDDIKAKDEEVDKLKEQEVELLLGVPNILDESVPPGADEHDNIIVREWGEKKEFDFEPKPHWDILEKNNLVDFERGAKLAGAKFYVYRNLISKLERGLIAMMLDTHAKAGYEELTVPLLVNDGAMEGTGQFPKFKGDYYTLERDALSLIPTAEVPLTNFFQDDIIPTADLPVYFTAATSCFRRESGAAGRDTRGLTRVHQFQKVEMVCFSKPEDSEAEHEKMLEQAEHILQKLGIHYRVLLLCAGDTSASSSKTYDLEVWMPGQNRYVEISSVSNFRDYQARRAKIRYKGGEQKKPALVHTLNGSGVAAGRAVAAIIENFQTSAGEFEIPEVLEHYIKI